MKTPPIPERYNADIKQQIAQTQKIFLETGGDGYLAFLQLRDLLLKQGEIDFESQITSFPYMIEIGLSQEEQVRLHLEEMLGIDGDKYIAFPSMAMGKYKHCVHNVYFKDQNDAVLFKLTYL